MPYLALGMLKVDKNGFGANPANRAAEFDMTVQQANAILKTKQSGRPGARMLVAPEYFWSGYGQIGKVVAQHGPLAMGRDDKHAIYSALKSTSKKAGSLVLVAGSIFYHKPQGTNDAAYNVCPVLRNGSFLLKAYKEFDDGAASKNPGTLDYVTKDSDPYFKVEGIGFGLEVCGEHGRLASWNATAGKTIHVQILVSDSMSIRAPVVVATRYVAQCDIGGSAMAVAVYPAAGPFGTATALPVEGISTAQVNGGTVHYWGLDV
ncbi:nitrilase-related carbon-nitrogen hydrolase [Roseococcus thiosulfatophilus]|uniref:nitrilase-related carbon-nitrogen hydrolase n=1 Tax=Roseococcus thiosulfatophilus TaxID=35813 RepID=UPI001A8E2E9C|nr:nitrilase-related carbon-nitrogen hydrolase [Roseococcus thiosulfatophilus]